jgi:hypothetical protein
MTLHEFLVLDHKSRLKFAKQAVHIAGRSNPFHKISLYQFNGFYIEIFYNRRYKHISEIHAFDDIDLLAPYLEKMEIQISN